MKPNEYYDIPQAGFSNKVWSFVAIGADGNVCAVKHGQQCSSNQISEAMIGMSEADFNRALNGAQVSERHRVESSVAGLRAIYYFRSEGCYTATVGYDPRYTLVVEALREPLTSINGFIELLFSQDYDEQTRLKLMLILQEQVQVMSHLIAEQLENYQWEVAAIAAGE